MKRVYNILFVICLFTVACSRQEVVGEKQITINARFPDHIEAKVSFSEKQDDTGLELSWEETDELKVVSESVETFTLTAIDGKKASFSGM